MPGTLCYPDQTRSPRPLVARRTLPRIFIIGAVRWAGATQRKYKAKLPGWSSAAFASGTVLAPRLEVLRVVKRLVANCRNFNRIGLAEILDIELATYLAVLPGQIGERYVLADGWAKGD